MDFELSFVHGVRESLPLLFARGYLVVPAPFFGTDFFPHGIVLASLSRIS